MKIIKNTPKLETERWDDPGDYPSGAGSGPLPSYDYVSRVAGVIIIELQDSDWEYWLSDTATLYDRTLATLQACLDEDPLSVRHDTPGLKVHKWSVDKMENYGTVVTLSVGGDSEDFEAQFPERDCDDYDD